VTLALPSVLFISFLEMKLEAKYIVVFVLLFLLNVALFGLGRVLQGRPAMQYTYFPFMMTGFEYGMLGVSLFGSAYGLDAIGYIAVIDLGHELFIWFVFLAFLLVLRDGVQEPRMLIRAFLTSPVIIGILAGILLNVLGLREDHHPADPDHRWLRDQAGSRGDSRSRAGDRDPAGGAHTVGAGVEPAGDTRPVGHGETV